MNKKAQLTPFIIIGIVILIAVSLFLYYRSILVPEPEIVPEDLVPIKNYVESCLSQVSEEAIIAIGSSGGYLRIPDRILLGNAYLEVIRGSSIKVPYWSFNGENYIPTIESMQNDISLYIESNIENCLNLDVFDDDYTIEELKDIKAETIIAKEDVNVELTYPLIIKDKTSDEQTRISKYHITVPVKLKQVYELGKNIMQAENQKTFFENMTIDWLSMNSNIPLNGLEFHCGTLKWRVSDIENELQDMIYYNLPKVKIKNTNHPGFLEDESVYEKLKEYSIEDIHNGKVPNIKTPADAYDYSHYLLDVRSEKTDLKAGFLYNPSYGIDLTVRPSEQGILRSTTQSTSEKLLSFMCLNTYHFTYDIVYPIQVLVRDDSSFNGKGYVFKYAFSVMINHNAPDRDGFLNENFNALRGDYIGECEGLSGETYDIRALGTDEFGIANTELKDVNISYDCFKFRCGLGKTSAIEGAYKIKARLPDSCSNGYIVAEKEGYLTSKKQLLEGPDFDIEIKRVKQIEFEIVMNDLNSNNNQIKEGKLVKDPYIATLEFQSYDDSSLIFLKRFPSDTENKINLILQNSNYKVDISLFDIEDNVLIGGYQADVSFKYSDIANADKIIFHALSYKPKPMNKEAEQKVWQYLEDNSNYKSRLKPELKAK